MNKFLFELGTEEIPAGMIMPALDQLKIEFEKVLKTRGLEYESISAYSTPRRLAIVISGLPHSCADRDEVLTGPPASVGFDPEGNPTPAAIGFARKMGADVSTLSVLKTDRGDYLSIRRQVKGDTALAVLKAAVPEIIGRITWPKNMYWRESRFRFIRPLRWYLALLNDQVVPFEFEGVTSGRTTRGHRMLGAASIEVPSVDAYAGLLRENYVLVDPVERRERIEAGLKKAVGGHRLLPDEGLLDAVVHLNEYPTVIQGSFDRGFLAIPSEVLVTVMRFHQKYFALSDEAGNLVPHFLTVVNTHGDPEGIIRQGHEKVLQARLEDAAFFWESDQKTPSADRVDKLAHVLFQEKLGTYLEKTVRLKKICADLAPGEDLQKAAELCKTDLTTEMVRELTELQGIMGGLYARQEGYPEDVWRAVYDHYKPVSLDDPLPETKTGLLLSIAERLDTLVGCFGIDIIPTGSSDPFALRRQAQGLISILLARRLDFKLSDLVQAAQKNFQTEKDPGRTLEQVLEFLRQRISFIFQREGIPSDVLSAVLAVGVGTVADAHDRASALNGIKGEADFEALAAAFKRIRNILAKGEGTIPPVNPALLVEPEEKALFEAFQRLEPEVASLVRAANYRAALERIASIRKVVDQFFDKVLVMAKDESLRLNRLALLNSISCVFLSIADISEIVQQGVQNG